MRRLIRKNTQTTKTKTHYISFIKFEWLMKSHRAQEEDLYEVMKHKISYFNDFKMKLLNRYLTNENKKYINVIYLDCYIKIFNYKFFLFNLTGFQVGPALVYLFLKSYFFLKRRLLSQSHH